MLQETRLTGFCCGALSVVVIVATVAFGSDRLAGEISSFLSIEPEHAAIAMSALLAFAFVTPAAGFLLERRSRRALQCRFGHVVNHDASTGLLNREGFVDRLDALLRGEGTAQNGVGIVHLDIIGLQPVNDSYGHEVGDELLKAVAADIAAGVEEKAIVARLGGAEFILAFPFEARHSRGYAQNRAHAAADRIMRQIVEPHRVAGHDIELSANMGVCTAPDGGRDAVSLMKSTHLALTAAKTAGPGAVRFYDRALETLVGERRAIERRVREAVANNSFELHFQPLYRNLDGKLAGYEALLRLPAGEESYVSPAVFVPIAEELGLISRIGEWVIRSACDFAAQWPGDYTVAVNLSPAQFRDGSVSEVVRDALAKSGLAPSRLELEITEGLLMNDTQAVLEELNTLKKLGVSIVMDDFGTGYSSLSYLWKFPFDKIKLDRSFMNALAENDTLVGDILTAIVSLSRSLHLRVTAEGVETQAQAAFLRGLACDQVQGFLFGRPMPMRDVAANLLRDAEAQAPVERRMAVGGGATH